MVRNGYTLFQELLAMEQRERALRLNSPAERAKVASGDEFMPADTFGDTPLPHEIATQPTQAVTEPLSDLSGHFTDLVGGDPDDCC